MPINRHRYSAGGGASGGGTGDVVGPASSTDDALARFDGATGKLLQDGLMTESDAGVVSGATQLNVDNLRLDGNTISTTNANGDLILAPNGTGNVVVPQGADGLSFGSGGASISDSNSDGRLDFEAGGSTQMDLVDTGGGYRLRIFGNNGLSAGNVTLTGSTISINGDVSLSRAAASVFSAPWINSSEKVALAADFTNDTDTMADLTGLSRTLLAGRKYTFRLVLYAEDSVAADGIKIDFDGGSATATNFRAHGTVYDTALLLSQQTTAIATDFSVGVLTGASMVEVNGSFEVNAAGTFIPRAAQAAHTAGTLTVNRGSYLWIHDTTYA